MKGLRNLTEYAYAALRFMSGWMFAAHGASKIYGAFTTGEPAAGSQIWIGGMIELIGGLMIALGFQTRWAAFICSGTMAVAYIQFHWKWQWNMNFLPAANKGELAVLYCFLFLYIACRGGGKLSLGPKD